MELCESKLDAIGRKERRRLREVGERSATTQKRRRTTTGGGN